MFVAATVESCLIYFLYTENEPFWFEAMGQRSYGTVPDSHGPSCGGRVTKKHNGKSEQERTERDVFWYEMKEKKYTNIRQIELNLIYKVQEYTRNVKQSAVSDILLQHMSRTR